MPVLEYSPFLGCSNGGRQGLVEAQRFPGDFDGIVSVAPAYDFTGTATAFVRNAQAAFRTVGGKEKGVVTQANLKLLQAKVLEACDANDGVKDGVLEDPRSCRFNVSSIRACLAGREGSDVQHCAGGAGPDDVAWDAVITDWVERSKAPDRVIASKRDASGKAIRTRPLCRYPEHALYTATGSTDEAANFACKA